MVVERAAGGVVFRQNQSCVEIIMIKDKYEKWALPKGKLEQGEDSPTAALREIWEETGVQGEIVDRLITVTYQYQDQNRGTVEKFVDYFLVRALTDQITPQPGEVLAIRWVELPQAIRECDYPNNLEALNKAVLVLNF